jgi:hypothetical protein
MNGARNILLKYLTKIPTININNSINLPIPSEKKIMFKEI